MKPFAQIARRLVIAMLPILYVASGPAAAEDLYRPGGWSSMASDRRASQAGDILTVIVLENSSGENSARNAASRDIDIGADIGIDSLFSEEGNVSLGRSSAAMGESSRAGRMVAQISVTVEEVRPNGDLIVAGEQSLQVNSEDTRIKLRGRVRPADVSNLNTVLSSRLADAEIEYDGSGFASRSARPGLITRVLNWLGL